MKLPKLFFLKTKKGKLIAVLGLVCLSVLTFWSYSAYQVRADKQRFEEASLLVDKIYADIVAELGQPEDYRRLNSCSRSYKEFTGYGDPTCTLASRMIYATEDHNESNAKLEQLQGVISRQLQLKQMGDLSSSIIYEPIANKSVQGAFDLYSFEGLECSAKYLFDSPSEIPLKPASNNKKTFYLAFICGGKARSLIYPEV